MPKSRHGGGEESLFSTTDCGWSEQASLENREAAFDRFVRFLGHTGVREMGRGAMVDWIRASSFDRFMDLLSVANGLLRGGRGFRRWDGTTVQSILKRGSATDLDPPDNAVWEFEKLFSDIRGGISVEDVGKHATKLFVGILFAHMFEDGNGRTARAAYLLLKTGRVPGRSVVDSQAREPHPVGKRLNWAAVVGCFRQEGVGVSARDDLFDYHISGFDGFPMGSCAAPLKYLAAARVLRKKGEVAGKMIDVNEFSVDEIAEIDREYAEVRRAWFWMGQRAAEKYCRSVAEYFDLASEPEAG